MSDDGPLTGMFHGAAPDPRDPVAVAAEHQAAREAAQAAKAAKAGQVAQAPQPAVGPAAGAATESLPLRPPAGAHRATHQPSRLLLPVGIAVIALALLTVGVIGWIHSGDPADSGLVVKPSTRATLSASTGTTPGSSVSTSPSSTASEDPGDSPSPTPSVTPTPTKATTPPPVVPVAKAPAVVLNQTAITGLAAKVAARLKAAGWTITGTGNWRGRVVSTTVYYPVGQEAAAKSLAAELGVDRIRPRVAGMLTNRLTVVLTSNPFA